MVVIIFFILIVMIWLSAFIFGIYGSIEDKFVKWMIRVNDKVEKKKQLKKITKNGKYFNGIPVKWK